MTTPYESDFVQWAREQSRLLRERRLDEVDADNVAEEIESWVRHFANKLGNTMELLLAALILSSVNRLTPMSIGLRELGRLDVLWLLDDFPAFKAEIREIIDRVWPRAVSYAMAETRLERENFPEKCPWPVTLILRAYWYPEPD